MPEIYHYLQQLVNGLTVGSTYALIAIGYTMVYGIIGMINFAHGEVYMIGSYIAFIAITLLAMMGLDSVPLMMLAAFAASIIVTSAFGYSIERVAYRPLRGGNRLIPLISAIGMSIFLQNAVMLSQDSRKGHPDPAARQLRVRRKQHERRGDLLYADPDLRRHLPGDVRPHPVHLPLPPGPRLPRLRRGPEDDQPAGYQQQQHHRPHLRHRRRPGRRRRGAAGHAVRRDQPGIGFLAGIKAFTAAVLGGIGSIPGAMLGGLLLGVAEAFGAGVFGDQYRDVVAFGLLILVLLFRPTGILGRPEVEKV